MRPAPVLVLGVGNILLQDEGIGVRVVQELQRRFVLPPEVEVMDGGTAGMSLLEDVMDRERVIIVDAVRTGAAPGTVVRLVDGEVPVFLQQRISPHQLGLSDLLAMLTLAEQAPRYMVLLGVVPESLELSLELSPLIEPKVALLVDQVVAELEQLGYRLAARVGNNDEVRV